QTISYKCDFEQGTICSFLSNTWSNKYYWRVGSGKLNAYDTGPSVDHTTGTANGTYLFVDMSAAKTKKVSLQTEIIKKDYCVRFFYHMYGAHIGSLTVSARSVQDGSDSKRFFYHNRAQGDRWKEAFFTATESGTMNLKGYKVIFMAKNNIITSVPGHIALDDIELTPGKCINTKNDATHPCSFDDYNCNYTSILIGGLSWQWKAVNRKYLYFALEPESDHTLGTSVGGYWYVIDFGSFFHNLQKAMLSSPVYKRPKTNLNCLNFYYYIDADGPGGKLGVAMEAYLQSFIKYTNSKEGQFLLTTKAKNITNHRQWTYAEVKANITADFQIQFVVGIYTYVQVVIAIDDIKLISGNCPETG
ncbi:unnamed protein product, partial [Larinioides sclopetarius]